MVTAQQTSDSNRLMNIQMISELNQRFDAHKENSIQYLACYLRATDLNQVLRTAFRLKVLKISVCLEKNDKEYNENPRETSTKDGN